MKKILLCFFCVFLLKNLNGQQAISGRVIDNADEHPLVGVSVFISGSSIGTTTDQNGYFVIKSVPPGNNDLIFSSVGYSTFSYPFTASRLPIKLLVNLEKNAPMLQEVVVGTFEKDGWKKWGRVFVENFIGLAPDAAKCTIKNTGVIHFQFLKKENILRAFTDEPLVIENKALGYLLTYDMQSFEINFNAHTTMNTGYYFYTNLPGSSRLKRKWTESREKAYYGSLMHFFRSVYADSIMENGYDVKRWKKIKNEEKERVRSIIRGKSRAAYADSMDYYETILRQPDFFNEFGKELLNTDSLLVPGHEPGEYKAIYFTDYLSVTYKNEKEDPAYLQLTGETRKSWYQRSGCTLIEPTPILIFKNGSFYPPQNVMTLEYWGWMEKIADALPIDYIPGQ